MQNREKYATIEMIAFSTSKLALRILRSGSAELLGTFLSGAFEEVDGKLAFRAPTVPLAVIYEMGPQLALMQYDALETELNALGIQMKEQEVQLNS